MLGNFFIHELKYGITVSTLVCCNITSETQILYTLLFFRNGSSLLFLSNQSNKKADNCTGLLFIFLEMSSSKTIGIMINFLKIILSQPDYFLKIFDYQFYLFSFQYQFAT